MNSTSRLASSLAMSTRGPSSNPVISSSLLSLANPAMARERTPDQSTAPRHIAHGSQLTTSCRAGLPGSPRFQVPSFFCARESVTTSAWALEHCMGSTRLTPTITTRPVSLSKTPAAKGPPVFSSTFLLANSFTTRIRSSKVSTNSGSFSFSTTAHSGNEIVKSMLTPAAPPHTHPAINDNTCARALSLSLSLSCTGVSFAAFLAGSDLIVGLGSSSKKSVWVGLVRGED